VSGQAGVRNCGARALFGRTLGLGRDSRSQAPQQLLRARQKARSYLDQLLEVGILIADILQESAFSGAVVAHFRHTWWSASFPALAQRLRHIGSLARS
jgi:hypothetical protein